MANVSLNQAQRAIALSERTFSGRAVNVISLKLELADFTALQVKEAVWKVLSGGDIFAAALHVEGGEIYFAPGERVPFQCRILPEMTKEDAGRFAEEMDRTPLDFPEVLYEAAAVPLQEGGSVLYVRFHHVIMDGYGMSLFAQKVLDVLAGKEMEKSCFFAEGNKAAGLAGESGLISETGPAGAEEPQAGMAGADSARFWREYFAEAELDAAPSGEPAGSRKKLSHLRFLEKDRAEEIRKFAEQNGVTVPYVLAGAYALYLAEAAGKKDAVFLMPRLNRRLGELGTFGCYTLLVPVRVRVEQGDTFAALCRRVQEAARLAASHKEDGFDNILQALREDDLTFGSLSKYAFNFYTYEIKTGLKYSLKMSVAGEMQNRFRWNIFREPGGGLSFLIDLQEGVYGSEKADEFLDGIIEILNRGMAGEEISRIPVTGGAERARLLAVRGAEKLLDEDATIPSLFRDAVARFGWRPAVYAGEAGYTFLELDAASDAVAGGLAEKGVQSGDSVAFMMKRDIRLIPVMLGIAKTGAAFIPVDPMYPEDRIRYILEDSGAKYLISSKDVETAAVYDYLEADELLAQRGERFELPEIRQKQTAYLIYTSGTTGRPKGVMISHRGIVNIVRPGNNPFNRDIVENGKGITAIGSICFDISLYEIFVPLLNGLFVELGNEKAMLDAGELAKHISRHGADILHCTPSRVASYLSDSAFSAALKGVKAMLMAGEVLPESLIRELKEHYGIRVYNGYGPTETTIGATMTEAGDTMTIGRPMENVGILLLNSSRKLVPWGETGEICIYGEGLGIGYRNRPRETEEKFIEWQGRRLYCTGDLGQLTQDGRLLYHGRNDRQIKLRGLRIELSEIERVMDQYQGTGQVCCVVRRIGNTEHLAGFYTVEKGGEVVQEALRAFMKERLTPYMVPDILKELEDMPQTPGGKTDLKALLEVPVEYVRSYRAPENDIQRAVCSAFARVLEVEKAGLDDSFFELGGDSLSAVELIVELEKELREEAEGLDYESLFRYPTPALLAEKISGRVEESSSYPIEKLDYTGIKEHLREHRLAEGDAGTKGKAAVGEGTCTGGRSGLGNVLITGATGYLGIHILMELLQNPDACGKVYCLVRQKGKISAVKRMKNALFYYAESDFEESYGEKWEAVEGDITEPALFREPFEGQIDTIINSAANVAHFACGDTLEQVNRNGVRNLIEYAAARKALICQISTISVGGVCEDAGGREFSEDDFYIGQKIFNQYIYTKYMAEYELLRAAADRGLAVKIMRVGNLQGRSRDGEFQMNLKSNGFTRRLSSYIKMGAVPESVYRASVNFSPVDETAHMITVLAGMDRRYRVFHVYPPEEVAFSRLFGALEKQGHKIEAVPEEEFAARIQSLKQTEEGRALVEGLLTDRQGGQYQDIPIAQKVTNRLLEEAGEKWLPVTDAYLNQYLSALEGMNMY